MSTSAPISIPSPAVPKDRRRLPSCVGFYDPVSYDVYESLGHRLYNLMTQLRREVELRMADHGLTDAQWKPLWLLKERRADTAFELAREMGTDAGAMTRMLDRLAAKGLVERSRSETDRRVVHLVLTAAGEKVAEEIPKVLAAVNNDYLAGFEQAEWQQMLGFIDRMRANGLALRTEEGA